MDLNLRDKLFQDIWKLPTTDIHTHIDAKHPCARGLHDILLYHMIITELYSSGCPDGARLSEEPDEKEVEYRIKSALPYLKNIENTSLYWGLKIILHDLYGWDDKITEENWRELDEIIKQKNREAGRAKEIADLAHIKKSNTELWRGHDHINDDMFYYSLEWSFFTRSQWGQYDIALLELEYSWNQDIPGPPLPVTLDRSTLNLTKTIKTPSDIKEAISHYCDKLPYDEISNITSHLSTDINYRTVTEAEIAEALPKRSVAGPKERDIYANYINDAFLTELQRRHPGFVVQYSIGAEPMPYETGSKLRTETVFELARQVSTYKDLKFVLYNANAHQDQALCTLVRELPNLSLAGYWWHNFFPHVIRNIISQRLDMLPLNKQFGFFSDAYCMDWVYGKAILVKKQLAEVLASKCEQGQYTYEQAIDIASRIL